MKALIDGDILVYRVCFAVEQTWWVCDGTYEDYDETVHVEFRYKKELDKWLKKQKDLTNVEISKDIRCGSLDSAYHSFDCMMAEIMRNTDATEYNLYLTGKGNFRDDVAKQQKYKENRKDKKKPDYFEAIRTYAIEKWNAIVSEGEEADDMIGYNQTKDTIICTIDKDLDMIPGKHYHIVKKRRYSVSESKADEFFWLQMIMGDATDNIPGLKGYGVAKAQRVIDDSCGYVEMEVQALYQNEFGDNWKEVMNEMAQLLWIRREPNEIKEVV